MHIGRFQNWFIILSKWGREGSAKTSMKTIISADRTCDLTEELYAQYGIETVPYHIILGGTQYRDNVDITIEEVFDYFEKHGVLPTTSAVNVGEYIEHFKRLREEAGEPCEIVHITLGSALTASFKNCCTAAEELGDIYVVDSCTLSSATGLQAIDASKMASEGKSAQEIYDYLTSNIQCYHASFVVDTMEYLKAGGRCSSIAAFAASALSIKPSIIVDGFNNGAMTTGKIYRGKFTKALARYVRDKIAQYDDIDWSCCMITGSSSMVDKESPEIVMDILKSETQFENFYVTQASCTIGSHCGPRTWGILFKTYSNSL